MSCDSRMTLAAWKQAMGYGSVRFVSDFWPHGRIGALYGAFDDKLGIDTRWTYVLDAGHAIREVIVQPELGRARDVESYVTAVRRLAS